MSTTLVKPAEVERKWYLLDATGKSLGHVAAEAAVLLRGKQKVDYTPNVDCGDFVVVINCDKAVLTGKANASGQRAVPIIRSSFSL